MSYDPHQLSNALKALREPFDKDQYTTLVDQVVELENHMARYWRDREDGDRFSWTKYHQAAIAGILGAWPIKHITNDGIVMEAADIADKAIEFWNKRFDRPSREFR